MPEERHSEKVRQSMQEIVKRNLAIKEALIPLAPGALKQVMMMRQLHQDIADLALVVSVLIPREPVLTKEPETKQ